MTEKIKSLNSTETALFNRFVQVCIELRSKSDPQSFLRRGFVLDEDKEGHYYSVLAHSETGETIIELIASRRLKFFEQSIKISDRVKEDLTMLLTNIVKHVGENSYGYLQQLDIPEAEKWQLYTFQDL